LIPTKKGAHCEIASPTCHLVEKPDLDQLKRQARELLDALSLANRMPQRNVLQKLGR
jgi:hypothetical protein